jgi:hypothetical protein
MGLVIPKILTGMVVALVVPFPSPPVEFQPQAHTEPLD